MIEKIHHGERLLAIIIPATFNEPGIHFCTQDDASQQIAFRRHPEGKELVPQEPISPLGKKLFNKT